MMVNKQGTKGVEQGIKLILETGHTLKASIATIQETVDSVQEIALSSKQQSLGTDQVSQTMRGINEGMKETATAATQTHKEAERLQLLSHELQEMINSYRVWKQHILHNEVQLQDGIRQRRIHADFRYF